MTTPSMPAQTASERRAAEADLRELIARFAPAHAKHIAKVRAALRALLPAAHELVYEYRDCFVISFSPSGRGFEGVFALRGEASGLKLYFNEGRRLPDPDKLLRGSGSQARWIALDDASTLARPPVVALIDAALALAPVAPAHVGGGSVIVRPTAAQSRRERPARSPKPAKKAPALKNKATRTATPRRGKARRAT